MNFIKFGILKIICLVVLICICSSSLANETYKYEVEQKISYDNVYTVTLKNRSGNIELEAYDEEKISVKIIKNINALDEQVARDFAQKIELKIEKSNDALSIEATLPEKRSETIDSISLDYEIKVPEDIDLKIQNENGNVVIKAIYGNQEIEVVNGDVELVNTVGKFNVKANSGNISGAILLNGESRFYTNNGNISIDLGDTLFYPTSAETDNGSITFNLPFNFSADLKANAPNGVVFCNLPASITRKNVIAGESEAIQRLVPRHKLREEAAKQSDSLIECVINEGGPLLQIKAANGNININEKQSGKKTSGQKSKEASEEKVLLDEEEKEEPEREQDTGKLDVVPFLDFNRVQGLVLGGALQVSTVKAGGGKIYECLEYGSANEMWNYQFGGEKSWSDKHKIAIGLELYKITDTNDIDLLSEDENFLSTLLFGEDIRDYFLRKGYKSWLSLNLTPSTKLRVQYNNDKYSSLFKMTDWSLFNPKELKSSNHRIDDGILKSITISYLFDSRDFKKHERRNDFTLYPVPCQFTKNGWLGYLSMEYAGKDLGGNFHHVLYQFKITRYNRISADHAFDFRIQGGISTESLPQQKIFYIGGTGTIRGYDRKEFVGDNMLLVNLEYSLKISRYIWSSVFWDSGYIYDREARRDDLHSSAGLGFKIISEDLSIIAYFAQPLEEDRGLSVILRLDRMF